jgi:aminomethyltransferase
LEEEVKKVRTGVGYSEYPFLNHQLVEGPDALSTLQQLCTRNLSACPPGRGLYTLMLDEDGHPVDDGVVLRLASDRFLVTVPGLKPSTFSPTDGFFGVKASKRWLRPRTGDQVTIRELGAFTVVVQGPRSLEMLRTVVDFERFPPWSVCETNVGAVPVLCSRTGFSGERGVEFLVWPEYAVELWETLAALGRPYSAGPFGIEATMVLGFEKGFLNAADFYPNCTPLELDLHSAVAFSKSSFVGRAAVLQRRQEGLRTRLVGLELEPNSPLPSHNEPIAYGDATVGHITNAAYCPTLGKPAARGFLPIGLTDPGTRVRVGRGDAACDARVAPTFRWYDCENIRTK